MLYTRVLLWFEYFAELKENVFWKFAVCRLAIYFWITIFEKLILLRLKEKKTELWLATYKPNDTQW